MAFTTTYLPETDSTNRWLRDHGGKDDQLVWTDYQTAGRGCGTNTWESERGKNLLFSVLLHPKGVAAASQFILSMANALALRDTLADYVDGIKIKWPNDIYWHDKKIAGTLIETTLSGSNIKTCIIGTGLNVNQTAFHSDAPNPVSLCQILGHEVDRQEVLQKMMQHLAKYIDWLNFGAQIPIRTLYRFSLYRRGETHRYRFTDGKEEECLLMDVDDDGHLVLQRASGEVSHLAFKEVSFII
ncbi:MAG: biotin--[acetyl-CoA-carboxylase] ligase [Prevotella sp.]|nr:biotin--[acetyl-CoA-carboxylase] ligase [Prevotella sp.]